MEALSCAEAEAMVLRLRTGFASWLGEPCATEALAKQFKAHSWTLHSVTKSKGGPGIAKYSKYFLVQFLQVEV